MPLLHDTDVTAATSRAGVEAATALRGQGYRAASAGRPADAAKLLRAALRELPVGSGDPDVVALRVRILITLAYAEAETGSVADGLAHLGIAHDLAAGVPDGSGLRAIVLDQQALILHRAGRTAEALALYDESVARMEAAGVDASALCAALVNRGLTSIGFGRPEEAAADMRRAVSLAEAEDLPLMKAKARNNLGDIALLTGDVPTALRHYEDADRALRTLAPDLVPRLRIDQARAMLTAGLAAEAARYLDEALDLLRRRRVGQDLAEAELARAAAALLLDHPETALEFAGHARRRFARRGSRSWAEVAALTRLRAEAARSAVAPWRFERLAERLLAVGLVDEAAVATLSAARMAVRRGRPVGPLPVLAPTAPIDHVMLLRLCRAEVAVAAGDPGSALVQAQLGLAELGRVRDRMGGLDLVCGTAVHGRELGELAVGLVLATVPPSPTETFDWLERTRAQVYRYEPLPVIGDPVLGRRVAESRSLSRSLQQARLDGRPVRELEDRLDSVQREVSRLGWHTSPWGRPRPVVKVADVTPRLGARAMVSFVHDAGVLSAVVLVDGRATLHTLGPAADALEPTRQLHADLDVLAPDHLAGELAEAVTTSAVRRAAVVDAALIRPLLPVLEDRDLVVVPTGGLYAVPWGVLPSLRGRSVVVSPSATAWVGASAAPPRGRTVLVGGPDLPEGSAEIGSLAEAYPDAVVLEGKAATVDAVLEALDGAGSAHIAAHGTHEADNALFSRLELFDGPLFAHEVTRLDRGPGLVVLASCELALSHIRAGDQALGFAGALLAGGSHTVVAAVSRVGDRAAAATTSAFHAGLAAGAPAPLALARAVAADPLRRPFVCFGS
ncbi:MAG TPA: CHAT domain-containing tetratricopeptide repeat protein [Umezawaea sp.]|nr:CHAT domain-containing tetratricopeptide repeat protein [Umezawaea sp.]